MISNADLEAIELGLRRRAIARDFQYHKINTCFNAKQTRWDRVKFFFGGKFDRELWIKCGKLVEDSEKQ